MGSTFSFCCRRPEQKSNESQEQLPKSYSWDNRPRVDPKQYTFDGIENGIVGKLPGEINGQNFTIQNCKNSSIYLFDHTASVTIDDCTNCKILIGPTKGSIFIRDCSDCNLMVACQQFRTRDCRHLTIFLHCATQPIIESSTHMRFACLQWDYPELNSQYSAVGLSLFNNAWSKIYDFTPTESQQNFTLLPEESNPKDYIPIQPSESFTPLHVDTHPSLIPLTLGIRRKPTKDGAFILLFSTENQSAAVRCQKFLRELQLQSPDTRIVMTKEIQMQSSDIERILGNKIYNQNVEKGPVVSVELNGPKSREKSAEILRNLHLTEAMFLVEEGPQTEKIIPNFYNFFDMQFGV